MSEKTETPVSDARPAVSAVGLSKVFRDFWGRPKAAAVNDIDFTVNRGEVFGLLGPNGSGKSTTVKMLLGLLYPTAGRLTVLDRSPRAVEIKRRIGYLPEETYLYKYLTAFETLDFFGALFGLSKAERANRAEQLLEMVGLSHARNRAVGEFSKGMARRIGLAQAMINDPEFLILDEPTAGLDPIGCREVKDLILTLKKRGKTVLITSHLLSDIEDVCDRVVILYGGKIRAEGPLNDLLQVENSDLLTVPHLKPEEMKAVLSLVRKYAPEGDLRVEHPRMTLEEFFLDVVAKAKADSSVSTAGAREGGGVAEYLSGKEDAPGGEALLNRLSRAEPEEEAQPEEKPREEEDARAEQVLKELQEKQFDSGAAERERLERETAELAAANEKLESLLGGKSGNGKSS